MFEEKGKTSEKAAKRASIALESLLFIFNLKTGITGPTVLKNGRKKYGPESLLGPVSGTLSYRRLSR